jgi:hypothetical protein
MRSISSRCVIALALAARTLAAQDLALPRQELEAVIKSEREARVKALTAEQKQIQKAITGGGKGFGNNRREAIINARKKLETVERDLSEAKSGTPTPELDVSKLEVGQIGKLYRNAAASSPTTVASPGGGATSFMSREIYRVPVKASVRQIIDAGAVVVAYDNDEKPLWLRMPTAGLTTGKTIALDKPLKVVATKIYDGDTIYELAFFADAMP